MEKMIKDKNYLTDNIDYINHTLEDFLEFAKVGRYQMIQVGEFDCQGCPPEYLSQGDTIECLKQMIEFRKNRDL